MLTVPAEVLRQIARRMLEAVGTPPDLATAVGDSLVEANLVGHDSHGVIRLTTYVRLVREGRVKPDARPSVQVRRQASARVDGAWGWGHAAAALATGTAVGLAREFGVGAVTIGQCNHIGRLGQYVDTIAREGMVGMAWSNAPACVAPYGGRQRLMGTNPIAWAVPRGSDQPPLVLDFATAGIAEGKLQVARAKGEQVRAGLILDREGQPSCDPADFYAGGVLLPFGEHKGYALSLFVELLAGALSGTAPSALPEYAGGNGTLLVALDAAAFVPMDQFIGQVEALCGLIQASPAAEGFGQVLLPGEPETMARHQRLRDGIALPDQSWQEIRALAGELNIAL